MTSFNEKLANLMDIQEDSKMAREELKAIPDQVDETTDITDSFRLDLSEVRQSLLEDVEDKLIVENENLARVSETTDNAALDKSKTGNTLPEEIEVYKRLAGLDEKKTSHHEYSQAAHDWVSNRVEALWPDHISDKGQAFGRAWNEWKSKHCSK